MYSIGASNKTKCFRYRNRGSITSQCEQMVINSECEIYITKIKIKRDKKVKDKIKQNDKLKRQCPQLRYFSDVTT